jgi:hypothetical protein
MSNEELLKTIGVGLLWVSGTVIWLELAYQAFHWAVGG